MVSPIYATQYVTIMFCMIVSFFLIKSTATTKIYTLSLHVALPIYLTLRTRLLYELSYGDENWYARPVTLDRKSTRLNSSHVAISYAVFCLKKKMTKTITII